MNTETLLGSDRRRLAVCLAVAAALHAVVVLNVDIRDARLPDPVPAIEVVLRQEPFSAPKPFSHPRPSDVEVETASTGEVSVPDGKVVPARPPITTPKAVEPLSVPSVTGRAAVPGSVLADATTHDLARNKRERERKRPGAVGPFVAGVAGPEAGPAHSEAKRGAGYGALARAIAAQAEALSGPDLSATETADPSPKVRRLTGPPSGDPELAYYLDSWRRKVERVGNINYPSEARSRGLSGTLRLLVVIDRDGALQDARILESSGHEPLDEGAVRIVNLAAPFSPFTKNMRARIDLLEIERRWRFRKDRLTPMP